MAAVAATGGTGAQKQFIHALIDESRERVVQVRAGQSLVHVLEHHGSNDAVPQQQHSPQRREHAHKHRARDKKSPSESTLPLLAPAMSLVYAARRQVDAATKSSEPQSDASAMRKNLRKRGVLELAPASHGSPSAIETLGATSKSSSSLGRHASMVDSSVSAAKFREYTNSKSVRVETLHQNDRRKAIAKSTKSMAQLVKFAQPPPQSTTTTGLVSALAAMKGKKALLRTLGRRKDAPALLPAAQDLAHIKNPHFAFLDFKRTSDEHDRRLARRAFGADESNTTARTPIHFGDQICFISEASDLPLSLGSDGRACAATTLSTGPHMMFTIVDFRNPSRQSVVAAEDEFWLRVDASLIRCRARASAAYTHGSSQSRDEPMSDDDDDDDESDMSHLLSETHYYLGCAGSIEDPPDDESNDAIAATNPSSSKAHTRGAASSYVLPCPTASPSPLKSHSSSNQSHDTFRLVAIKATVPSVEYYGDDSATREYTIETNESAMHLARWRFTLNSHAPSMRTTAPLSTASGHKDASAEDASEETRLLLNCASVYLSLNHFVLESDSARHHRGVLRDFAKRSSSLTSPTRATAVHDIAQTLRQRGKTHASAASWQVRLLRPAKRARAGASPRKSSPGKAAAAGAETGPSSSSSSQLVVRELLESTPAEWLKKKRETVERTAAVIRDKRALALTAKQSYELVASQSNRKLIEIEQHKARHQLAYFQSRYHAIFEDEHSDQQTSPERSPQALRQVLLPRLK